MCGIFRLGRFVSFYFVKRKKQSRANRELRRSEQSKERIKQIRAESSIFEQSSAEVVVVGYGILLFPGLRKILLCCHNLRASQQPISCKERKTQIRVDQCRGTTPWWNGYHRIQILVMLWNMIPTPYGGIGVIQYRYNEIVAEIASQNTSILLE